MTVYLKHGESQEDLLRRVRKQAARSGILKAVRKKRWYVSKGEQRRRAKARAIRKARRRRQRSNRHL